jgi:hypothetical protein
MYKLRAEAGSVNFSSPSFHIWAQHYYKCVQDFRPPNGARFSPVPYALLCRAIELELKSQLLKTAHAGGPGQPAMKKLGHDLEKAYDALEPGEKVLTPQELDLLCKASAIYKTNKCFDYIQTIDAAHGYSRFPDLPALNALPKKLLGATA